jgi:hypothetical protein
VGEALWADFQRICEGDSRVLHFRFPYTPPRARHRRAANARAADARARAHSHAHACL